MEQVWKVAWKGAGKHQEVYFWAERAAMQKYGDLKAAGVKALMIAKVPAAAFGAMAVRPENPAAAAEGEPAVIAARVHAALFEGMAAERRAEVEARIVQVAAKRAAEWAAFQAWKAKQPKEVAA